MEHMLLQPSLALYRSQLNACLRNKALFQSMGEEICKQYQDVTLERSSKALIIYVSPVSCIPNIEEIAVTIFKFVI